MPACSPALSLTSPPSSPALGLRHHDRTDQVLVKILKIFNGMGWLQVVKQGAGRRKSGCAIVCQADCCPDGATGREEVEKLRKKLVSWRRGRFLLECCSQVFRLLEVCAGRGGGEGELQESTGQEPMKLLSQKLPNTILLQSKIYKSGRRTI